MAASEDGVSWVDHGHPYQCHTLEKYFFDGIIRIRPMEKDQFTRKATPHLNWNINSNALQC